MEDDEIKDKEEDEAFEKASDSDFVLRALKDETNGISSYDQALQTVQDPKLKEILAAIKEDEAKHNAALEEWLKANDPEALEGHEAEESGAEESLEDDEAAEGAEEKDESGSKEDLIAEIQAILAEHDGEAEKDDESEEDLGKEDNEDSVDKCRLDKFMPIVKLDSDEHKAYCVVAEPDVFDLQGDRSSIKEIEKASDRFMARLQKTCAPGVGLNHEKPIDAHIIENVVTKQDGLKLGDQILRKGTWYQGHKIEDPEVWEMIKSGEITGLSRQGEGVRSPVDKGLTEMHRISKSGKVVKNKLYDLSDEDIDRIDWVHKGANGARIAIIKFTGRKMMKSTKPAGATGAGAGEAQVITKADIAEMVAVGIRKAIEPIAKENRDLRKSQKILVDTLRRNDLERIAKSDLGELGNPQETAKILKSLEDSNLPAEAQKQILTTLRQANAVKKEAGKLLYNPLGSSRPAPGSAMEQFYALVDSRAGEIKKSAGAPKDQKVLKALAVAAVTREQPELAKAVLAEERAGVVRAQMGVS